MVRRTESMPPALDGAHSDDGEIEADAAGPPAPPPAPPQSEWRAVNRMAQHIPGLKVTGGEVPQMRRGSSFTREESSPLNSQVRLSLLDNLTPKQSEACVAAMSVVEFTAGDDIVMQGSFGTTMYFLDTGAATAYVADEAVNQFGPGEFFGELAFITTAGSLMDTMSGPGGQDAQESKLTRRSATVRAMENCRCLELNVKDFVSIFEGDAEALGSALRHLIQETTKRFQQQKTQHVSFNGTVPTLTNMQSASMPRLTDITRSESTSSLVDSRSSLTPPGSVGAMGFDLEETVEPSNEHMEDMLKAYVNAGTKCMLLDLMSDRSRMQCIARMKNRIYAEGDKILELGQVGDSLFLIKIGSAHAALHEQVVQVLECGSFFGEIAFLATCSRQMNPSSQSLPRSKDQLRTCDVVASEHTECYELTVADFLSVVGKNPDRNRDVIRALSKSSKDRIARLKRMAHCPSYVAREPSEHEQSPSNRDIEFGRIFRITSRLAFSIHVDQRQTKLEIMRQRDVYFFSSTFHESYVSFCEDDGPVNLSAVAQFCWYVRSKLTDPRLEGRTCVYYAESNSALRSNAIFLLAAFLVLVDGYTPEQAVECFEPMGPSAFCGFRDALPNPSSFRLLLGDLLHGISGAVREGWFDIDSFDLDHYLEMDDPSGYDIHQPCPKLVAFRGPDVRDSNLRMASEYCTIFKDLGVTAVVRLNEKESYPREEFIKAGIRHYELEFPDCTVPTSDVVYQFLDICDKEEGAVAVHCRAGLGRTGTLIALWMMRGTWKAREAIGWLRIVRPGSVLGMQQEYLEACEDPLRTGRLKMDIDIDAIVQEAGYHASIGDDVMQAVMNRQNVLIRENMPESAEQGGGGGSVGTSSAATPVSVVESTGDDTEDGAEAGGGGAVEEVQAGAVVRARFVDDAEFKTIDIRSDHLEYMKHISMNEMPYPLMGMMTDLTRDECTSRLRHRTFKRGDSICKRGAVGDSLYFVKSGMVHCLLHTNDEGNVVQELESGAYFGEIAFLGNCIRQLHGDLDSQQQLRTCDVVAACDCELWELSVLDFAHCIHMDVSGNSVVLRELSNSSRDRIARLLVVRADCTGLQGVREALTFKDEEAEASGEASLHSADGVVSRLRFFVDQDGEDGRIFSILPDRLSFTLHRDEKQTKSEIEANKSMFFFSTSFQEAYVPLRKDDGPVNIVAVVRFCEFLKEQLADPRLAGRHLVYYSEMEASLRSNALFLMGTYLVLVLEYTVEQAMGVFEAMGKNLFRGFRDASSTPNNFRLSLRDCLHGVEVAVRQQVFDLKSFDLEHYIKMDEPSEYDIHRVCPKCVVFRGPDVGGTGVRTCAQYASVLKDLGVTAVVRLNEKESYAADDMVNAGMRHYDLEFPVNTFPTSAIVDEFFEICAKEDVVAVHCRAGLGRSCTLIARYCIKMHGFKSRQAIAWMRIMIPGSIRGAQQDYLVDCEERVPRSPALSAASCAAANLPLI